MERPAPGEVTPEGGGDGDWTTFQTSSLAAAREFAARTFGGRDLMMTGTPGSFEFSLRSRHLPLFGVDLVRHSGHLETTRARGDDVHLVEVLRGTLCVRSATGQVTIGTGQALMTSGDEVRTVTWDDVRLVVVRLDELELRTFASELADVDLASNRFRLSRVASEGHARHWSAAVRYVVQGVLDNRVASVSPLAQHECFRLLASTALEAFHQIDLSRARPGPADASPAPTTIRRAVEFIEANAHRPIGVEDIARAARLSVRGTQAAFHRHMATSPAAYLRRVRLAGAHRDLVAADPTSGESVSDIAARWGFLHQGHFAANYREVYGVAPSYTLAH
jgi:AraC-like DNA-binding protein